MEDILENMFFVQFVNDVGGEILIYRDNRYWLRLQVEDEGWYLSF